MKGPNYFPWNVIFTLLPPVLFHPQCKTSFSFGLVMIHRWTQLFRVRLSYERGRAYATMSKVIVGNSGFTVALLNLRCFSVVEGNSTNRCIHAFSFMSFLVAESPWNSIKQSQTLTTHNTNRHCRVRFYSFVGQPLSKQLYTNMQRTNITSFIVLVFKPWAVLHLPVSQSEHSMMRIISLLLIWAVLQATGSLV